MKLRLIATTFIALINSLAMLTYADWLSRLQSADIVGKSIVGCRFRPFPFCAGGSSGVTPSTVDVGVFVGARDSQRMTERDSQ